MCVAGCVDVGSHFKEIGLLNLEAFRYIVKKRE